jgi:hypothetical protein
MYICVSICRLTVTLPVPLVQPDWEPSGTHSNWSRVRYIHDSSYVLQQYCQKWSIIFVNLIPIKVNSLSWLRCCILIYHLTLSLLNNIGLPATTFDFHILYGSTLLTFNGSEYHFGIFKLSPLCLGLIVTHICITNDYGYVPFLFRLLWQSCPFLIHDVSMGL